MNGARDTRTRPEKTRLETWKAVAAFFGKTERTVKRWEKDRGLPIHRLPGSSRSRIYAEIHELESWLRGSGPDDEVAERDEPENPTAHSSWEEINNLTVSTSPSHRFKPAHLIRMLVGTIAVMALLTMATLLNAHFHAPRQPATLQAETAYLKGLDAFDDQGPQALMRSITAFQQAIHLSPDYAEAYVGLAHSLMQLPDYGVVATHLTPAQAFAQAETSARKAVALDHKLGSAQAALGLSRYYGVWDTLAARKSFHKALKLSPESALTHFPYARFLMLRGAYGEALSEINQALVLNPSSPAIKADRALLLALTGHRTEGLELISALIVDEPHFATAFVYRAEMSYATDNDRAACMAWITANDLLNRPRALSATRAGLAALDKGGHEAMLHAILSRQLNMTGHPDLYETGAVYAALGDAKNALLYLNKAVQSHDPELVRLGLDPRFSPIRQDPAFGRFAARFVDKPGG